MKIALIRRHFSAMGGAELYLQRLLSALAKDQHELHLFTEAWPQTPKGVIVHSIPTSGSRAERPRRFAEAARTEVAKQAFDCIFSLDRTLKQDVYRAGDGVHGVWLERRRQFAPWWRKPFIGRGGFHTTMMELEAVTLSPENTRHVIANSEMVRREILDHFDFPAERIHVVRNGVEVARFHRGDRSATRARFGVTDDEFLLLFVGSGWERKGLVFLLEAMACCLKRSPGWLGHFRNGIERSGITSPLRNSPGRVGVDQASHAAERIRLLVVGKDRPPLRFPKNVIFAGAMAEIENAYAAADLFAFLPIYEPSANVVFEALAAGLPVVTSSLNGAGEAIQERVNGTVLADPSDAPALAEAIAYWWSRRVRIDPLEGIDLSLERNLRETLAILELAAGENLR